MTATQRLVINGLKELMSQACNVHHENITPVAALMLRTDIHGLQFIPIDDEGWAVVENMLKKMFTTDDVAARVDLVLDQISRFIEDNKIDCPELINEIDRLRTTGRFTDESEHDKH